VRLIEELPSPGTSGRTRSTSIPSLLGSTGRFQNLERTHKSVVYGHHSSSIVKFTAVVRRRKDSHQLTTSKEFITIFNNLVSPDHQVQVMSAEELTNNVTSECKGNTTIIFAPSLRIETDKSVSENVSTCSYFTSVKNATYSDAWVRISPENIAQQSSIRDVTRTGNIGNLFHLRQFRGKTSVHTNDLIVNHRTTRQAIEGIAKLLPHLDREATTALIVKAINSVDSGTFMVSPQQKEVFRVLNFVGKQQANNF
jgi:hypothetical protein